MATEWFYKAGDYDCGPLTPERLIELVAQRRIGRDTLVRKGNVGQWISAKTIKSLKFPESNHSHPPAPAKRLVQENGSYKPDDSPQKPRGMTVVRPIQFPMATPPQSPQKSRNPSRVFVWAPTLLLLVAVGLGTGLIVFWLKPYSPDSEQPEGALQADSVRNTLQKSNRGISGRDIPLRREVSDDKTDSGLHKAGLSPHRCIVCGNIRSAQALVAHSDRCGYGLCNNCGSGYSAWCRVFASERAGFPQRQGPDVEHAQAFLARLKDFMDADPNDLSRGIAIVLTAGAFPGKDWENLTGCR